VERRHQVHERAAPAVELPHEDHIELALAGCLEQLSTLRAVLFGARAVPPHTSWRLLMSAQHLQNALRGTRGPVCPQPF
jgi:hypothetical protein